MALTLPDDVAELCRDLVKANLPLAVAGNPEGISENVSGWSIKVLLFYLGLLLFKLILVGRLLLSSF